MTDLNELVNRAMHDWASMVEMPEWSRDNSIARGTMGAFDNAHLLEEVNQSRELDPSGLTSFMMLRGIVDGLLKQATVSLHDLMFNPDKVDSTLAPLRDLWQVLCHEEVMALVDDFKAKLLAGATFYGVKDKEKLAKVKEWIDDPWEMAFLRRDALKSAADLHEYQFTQGEPAAESLKWTEEVLEFWNINSLLEALKGQDKPGISLVLMRDPEEPASSYFAFAIRNGGTITIVTDREAEAYPGQRFNRRRPDRLLEARSAQNWFPYQLLKMEVSADAQRAYAKQRNDLVPIQDVASLLSKVRNLEAPQILWLAMMFEILNFKYGKANLKAPELSYTAAMIRQPEALASGSRAIVPANQYQALELPALKLEDVRKPALKGVFEHEGSEWWDWYEQAYYDKVPSEVLNLVGSHDVKRLPAGIAKAATVDDERGGRELAITAYEPTEFGSKAELDKGRRIVARRNAAAFIKKAAKEDYEKNGLQVAKWYDGHIRKNLDYVLEACARGELVLPALVTDTFAMNVGERQRLEAMPQYRGMRGVHVEQQNCLHAAWGRHIWDAWGGKALPRIPYGLEKGDWGDKRGAKESLAGNAYCQIGKWALKEMRSGWNHTGKGKPKWDSYPELKQQQLCAVTGAPATYFARIEPESPEALAKLCGVRFDDLPRQLQTWAPESVREPYEGNSILDNLDPVTDLENPWAKFDFSIVVFLSRAGLDQLRAKHGLPGVKPHEAWPVFHVDSLVWMGDYAPAFVCCKSSKEAREAMDLPEQVSFDRWDRKRNHGVEVALARANPGVVFYHIGDEGWVKFGGDKKLVAKQRAEYLEGMDKEREAEKAKEDEKFEWETEDGDGEDDSEEGQ